MCQYIKDDGEQCGRTAEPFCHQHEDTRFAKLWERQDRLAEVADDLTFQIDSLQNALNGGESGSSWGEMETVCQECESALRRRERLREHPNYGNRRVFEAYVECDCSEYVLGVKAETESRIPDGWYE